MWMHSDGYAYHRIKKQLPFSHPCSLSAIAGKCGKLCERSQTFAHANWLEMSSGMGGRFGLSVCAYIFTLSFT